MAIIVETSMQRVREEPALAQLWECTAIMRSVYWHCQCHHQGESTEDGSAKWALSLSFKQSTPASAGDVPGGGSQALCCY